MARIIVTADHQVQGAAAGAAGRERLFGASQHRPRRRAAHRAARLGAERRRGGRAGKPARRLRRAPALASRFRPSGRCSLTEGNPRACAGCLQGRGARTPRGMVPPRLTPARWEERSRTSALSGRRTGRERATVQAVSRSIPRGGARSRLPGAVDPGTCPSGHANSIAAGRRAAHGDGERHGRQPDTRNQDEEHGTDPVRRPHPLVGGLGRACPWLASRFPSNEWLHGPIATWRPHVTARLFRSLGHNPGMARGRAWRSLCGDHTSVSTL